jgi:hypothetical protein
MGMGVAAPTGSSPDGSTLAELVARDHAAHLFVS